MCGCASVCYYTSCCGGSFGCNAASSITKKCVLYASCIESHSLLSSRLVSEDGFTTRSYPDICISHSHLRPQAPASYSM